MEIKINNQTQNVDEKSTLQSIVFSVLGEKQKGIAVALNDKVISKNSWAETNLRSNDHVLIIKATQGG
jgi:sulfur carrier protein